MNNKARHLFLNIKCYLFVGIILSLLSACSTSKTIVERPSARKSERKSIRTEIVETAEKYIGVPYQYGGKSAKGFDCSGFISKVFSQHQISIIGSSTSQSQLGKAKNPKMAKPGDLVFFKKNRKINHVALVVGNNDDKLWVIHSTSSRGVIKESILESSYWSRKDYFVKDILN